MSHKPRKILAAELPAVALLWHDAWHETQAPHVPAALIALRTQDDFLRRVTEMGDLARTFGPEGQPLGFCAVKENELDQLFISPQARGTGAAAALIRDAEDRLRHAGTVVAELDCLKENKPAIRFYTKMGWTDQGVQQVTLDTSAGPFWINCIVFRKRLIAD